MYYGAGLLSTVDRYPDRRVSRPVPPPPTTRGRRGRPSDRGSTRGTQKSRRGRARESRAGMEGGDMVIFLFFYLNDDLAIIISLHLEEKHLFSCAFFPINTLGIL